MCSIYAIESSYKLAYMLTYNESVSYSLCFKPKHIKFHAPRYLNKLEVPRVDLCTCLGIMIDIK